MKQHEAPTEVVDLGPEALDKAMQALNRQVYESAEESGRGGPARSDQEGKPDAESGEPGEEELPSTFANFVIRPQAVYGTLTQQTLDGLASHFQKQSETKKGGPSSSSTKDPQPQTTESRAETGSAAVRPKHRLDVRIEHLRA